MTFKCDLCAETSKPREPMFKVVSGVRDKQYGPEENLTFGFEITTELCLCEACHMEVTQANKELTRDAVFVE